MDDGGSESVAHEQGNEAELQDMQTQPAYATVGRIQGEYMRPGQSNGFSANELSSIPDANVAAPRQCRTSETFHES